MSVYYCSQLKNLNFLLRPKGQLCSVLPKTFPKSPLSATLQRLLPTSLDPLVQVDGCKEELLGISLPRLGFTRDQGVRRSNLMITKLAEEGQIFEARKLFDKIPVPDVISWTAVISGYINCGMVQEARNLFDKVDAKKNVATWTAMISGYVQMKKMFDAERLFDAMPEKNVFAWNTMINGYVKSGMLDKALCLFARMKKPNDVSWNILLSGLLGSGQVDEALEKFHEMPERNLVSWTVMVSGLCRNGRVDEARILFDKMPERNVVSWNAMISGYAQNLRLDEAFNLFDGMPEKDVRSWNAMITGCIRNGDIRRANMLFNKMPERNVVSWSSMINGYVQSGQNEDALRVFCDMLEEGGVRPNERTFASALVACSDLAALRTGKQFHQLISKTVYQRNVFIISAIMNMYSKCGDLTAAAKVFHDEKKRGIRDLVSWNCMIAAYAHHGCTQEAMHLFQEMHGIGLKPNEATYLGLLVACSYAGLVGDGFKYLKMLVNDKSMMLREEHLTCLIDLFGRAGRLKEAFEFIQQGSGKPSAYIWGAFLAGCKIHEDAERGKLAAGKLWEAEPESINSIMVLFNIYACNGNRKEAVQLRRVMKDHGLKKQPGCSWTEVGNQIHVFAAGDESHNETMQIHSLIRSLHSKMKKADDRVAENASITEYS